MKNFSYCVLLLLMLLSTSLMSQDLTNIKDAKKLTITGGVSADQTLYWMNGMESRRDPHSYFLSGNINFNFYDVVNAPFSFTYSNQQANFQQPFNFNQFGITPSYKWIQAYIGFNTMTFSKYTLNGHTFLGGGIKLTPPGIFRFSAMYGRFQKPVEEDTTNANVIPGFKRMGYGFSIGLEKERNFAHISVFSAKDDTTSLSLTPEKSGVLPMENLVFGLNVGKSIGEKIAFTFEIATSALTRDLRAKTLSSEGGNIIWGTGIFNNKESTSYYNAMNSALTYTGNGFSVGLGYERVDPEYKTLGAYYFTNDLENITLNTVKSFLQGKLNANLNIGVQRNNLDDSKLSSMRNIVSALSINYQVNNKLNLAGSFTNFNSYTHIRSNFETINQVTPYENLDTLNFTLLTTSANVGASYSLGDINSDEKRENINLNITYQNSANEQNNNNSNTAFYNGNLSYNRNSIPRNTIMSASVNFSYNVADTIMETLTIGPTLSLSKQFFEKKLKTTASSSLNFAYNNGDMENRVWNFRLTGTYTLKEKHAFNLSFFILNRKSTMNKIQKFTEYTCTVGYNYNF